MAEYIEREELIARLKRDLDACNTGTIETLCFRGAIMIAQSLPAADVVPVVHAQWEGVALVEVDSHGEIYRIPNAGLGCSRCMCGFDKNLLWRRNYCPNCGAKMDGGTT